jgi:hypothetical protein
LATLVSLFLREDLNEEVDFLGKLMDEILVLSEAEVAIE